jgi:hypothetical protein
MALFGVFKGSTFRVYCTPLDQGKLALDNIDLEMQMERKDLIGNPKSDLF